MHSVITTIEGNIKEVLEHFKQELAGIRSNRPTSALVEDIVVAYYGQPLPIKQLGSIAIVLPREIVVTFWDKNAIGPAEQALRQSGIGLGVAVDGTTIRLSLPPLTDERRGELIKLAKQYAEECRIRIRGMREEANKKIAQEEEAKLLSEDQKFSLKEEVQKRVDGGNKSVEQFLDAKIGEISQ